jgi:hypothetical protein
MLRHFIPCPGLVIAAVALTFFGCGKSPDTPHSNTSAPAAVQPGASYSLTAPPDAIRAVDAGRRFPVARSPVEQARLEDFPPWPGTPVRNPKVKLPVQSPEPIILDAWWLHDPDPNFRLRALEAWARQPAASLDPITSALVDPDESVRARAQELLEQKLNRP